MTLNQHRIMVVDDDPGMRMTLAVIIEEEGYDVVEASDYQAIELAKENSLDLIFMDIIMPGMHGVDAFREIKKLAPARRWS